ncbi:MAG TPA: universal stress protein, partial [Tabrizicola sp.]|nr:universal stress protein [Tabrizicola sp.]
LLAQAALFDSGRPLVIAPQGGTSALPRKALIAWDGTHAAARAMQDALSLLPPGAEAVVARVTDDKMLRMDQSGIEAAHHLSRHGIKAEFHDIPRTGRDVYDALLSAAQDSACDLIVTGAVRHSPIHELVFGSVTGRVLDGDCPLPVLLAA